MFHFKSWLMIMPSILALVTSSRGLPFRTRGSKSWLFFENPIRSFLHLASFSWNPSILACLERSFTASWSLLTLPFYLILLISDVGISVPSISFEAVRVGFLAIEPFRFGICPILAPGDRKKRTKQIATFII